ELDMVRHIAIRAGARDAVVTRHFSDGGAGATDLAAAVWSAAQAGAPEYAPLYPDEASLREKIDAIATRIYGAEGVDELPAASKALDQYERMGFGRLPICMAKTQYSLSHDPALKGGPSGFRIPIREVHLSAGAGFVTPILGEMRTMPGLPSRPGGEMVDIDADGNIIGLF
ncbi:MAG: formate--tetrahydrofolate ligase, partial [Chloroflexi bacterium]|nr:formate--tetrahydrofolate ligase [Chloroflexota bacterium]